MKTHHIQCLYGQMDSRLRGNDKKRWCVKTHPAKALRTKIEPDPDHPAFITTVREIGYRFDLPESE